MVATRTLGRARRADTVRILFEWNDDALNGVPLIAEVCAYCIAGPLRRAAKLYLLL
jgi:hypothetical protein